MIARLRSSLSSTSNAWCPVEWFMRSSGALADNASATNASIELFTGGASSPARPTKIGNRAARTCTPLAGRKHAFRDRSPVHEDNRRPPQPRPSTARAVQIHQQIRVVLSFVDDSTQGIHVRHPSGVVNDAPTQIRVCHLFLPDTSLSDG